RAAALHGPHGRVTGYLGTNLDITERKKLEEQVRGVLESAPDAMVLVNGDGEIVLANAQTVKTFGYQREELLYQRVDVLLPERYQGGHPAQRAAYAAAPGPRLLNQRPGLAGRRKDGSEFPAEVALTPIETEEGLLVVAAVRDVTHRVEMEQSLRSNLETQSAFTALLRVGLEPLSLEDYLGRALDILFSVPWIALESKGAIYLIEDEPRVLVMRAARGLPDHVTASCHRVPFGCCLCGRAAESRQLVFGSHSDPCHERQCHEMPPHGHYCVPIASATTLLGVIDLYVNDSHEKQQSEADFLRTVASLLAGIIRRRQAESALWESEERFQLAVRGTDAGIWDWNLTTNRVYFSARWKQMLGYDEQEIKDDFREWERLLHRDDLERALRTIGDYLAGRTSDYELEHRLRHKDGTYRWILARGAAVRDEQGNVYRMVGSHLDITQRKRSEQMLRERESQLLAAQRIQEYILPRAAPDVAGFDMAGKLIPAEFAAGDYFDYVRLPDGTLGVVVGDVSGHGVGAALLMATISAHLRSYAEEHSNVEEILQHVNSFLCREVEDVHFVTFFFARLDPQLRTLHYINAGHPRGHVLNASGALKAVLDRGTMPLAVMEDITFELHGPIQLEAGDVVLLITDGFLEAFS
ncbi:MAG: PAS domain S-box protein, partial [Planctomycetes bacterium]|nr:PAS domain S-box protein [Planctomycetota bacterium]